MYKVIVAFRDLQDGKRYAVGDVYTGSRAEELASNKNKAGRPLIKEVSEPKKEEPVAVPEEVSEPEEVEETKEAPAKKTRGRKKGK